MEKAIESEMRSLQPSLHDWAISCVLSHWHFVVEDDDPSLEEEEHIDFVVHNLGVLASPDALNSWLNEYLLKELPGMYDEDIATRFLAQEWGVGGRPTYRVGGRNERMLCVSN